MGVFVQQSLGEFTNSKSTVVTNVGVADTPTASLKAEDGLMTVSGTVVKGDVFTFDVAGTSLSVVAGDGNAELSAKGVAGQIVAATQEANISGVDVLDNGDGTVSFGTTAVKITDAQSAKDYWRSLTLQSRSLTHSAQLLVVCPIVSTTQ